MFSEIFLGLTGSLPRLVVEKIWLLTWYCWPLGQDKTDLYCIHGIRYDKKTANGSRISFPTHSSSGRRPQKDVCIETPRFFSGSWLKFGLRLMANPKYIQIHTHIHKWRCFRALYTFSVPCRSFLYWSLSCTVSLCNSCMQTRFLVFLVHSVLVYVVLHL